MNRVKDLKKVILGDFDVLAELNVVTTTVSGIILPDKQGGEAPNFDYCSIIKVGDKITDLKEGDIILDTRLQKFTTFDIGSGDDERKITILGRSAITMATTKENFDLTKIKPTLSV